MLSRPFARAVEIRVGAWSFGSTTENAESTENPSCAPWFDLVWAISNETLAADYPRRMGVVRPDVVVVERLLDNLRRNASSNRLT